MAEEAGQRRIDACLAACEGLDTEALERIVKGWYSEIRNHGDTRLLRFRGKPENSNTKHAYQAGDSKKIEKAIGQ